jgi:hypothetical protein
LLFQSRFFYGFLVQRLLQPVEGVRVIFGVLGIDAGDRAPLGGGALLVSQGVGQRRQQVSRHRLETFRPAPHHQGVLGHQRQGHVAGDPFPSAVALRIRRQRAGHAQALGRVLLGVLQHFPAARP